MRTSFLILAIGLFLAGNLASQVTLDSARRALAESLPEVAVARAERFLAANPDLDRETKAKALLFLGESYFRNNQVDQALKTLAQVPDSSASTRDYWQGMALAHQKKYPQALEKLSQIDNGNPLYSSALFNTLEINLSQNEADSAFELLKKLRAHDPQFLPAQLSLLEAQIYLGKDKPEEARNSLQTLMGEEKPSPESLLLAGQIELSADQPDVALQAFQKALIPEAPSKIKALALLGTCDAHLQAPPYELALEPLLLLLQMDENKDLLSAIDSRLELLVDRATFKEELFTPLAAFVKPNSLGEDGNLLSPQKLLACYYLSRISPIGRAKELLEMMVTLAPKGEITARAHLQLSKLALENGDDKGALQSLQNAQKAAPESTIAIRAADLSARIKAEEGDFAAALPLFSQASRHPNAIFSERALLNQALLTLANNPEAPLSAISAQLKTEDGKVSLKLEKALALARDKAPKARPALEEFLFQHPDHPRTPEARLALTDLLLSEQKPDFELIEVQLASLPATLGNRRLSRQHFRVSHKLGVITGQWDKAVTNGEKHRIDYPEAENDPYFLLRLGESNYREGNSNRSSILFSKVAALPGAGELVELALYFGAISNLANLTEKATTKGLDTLDIVIERAGPLATRARMTKARTQLKNLGRAQECLETLDGIPGDPGDQPEAALLAAQAYRELSANDVKLAEKAASIYRRLLDDPRTSYQLSNQIHYQLSRTYSESGFPNLAIDPCLTVVDFENRAPDEKEVEWDYYYRCGFEAIDILLTAKHPRAALILARKLAQTEGPNSEKAAERARQIQLEHQLFED